MRIIFATWANVDYQAVILTYEKAADRLISYVEVRDKPNSFVERYVREGVGPSRAAKPKGGKGK